jgi:STE24 endopeptidase
MKKLWFAIGAALIAAPALAQAPAFDPEAATQAYMATLSGAARAKSDAYFEGGYWLLLWGAIITVAVNLLFLSLGWSRRLSDWAGRRTKRPFLRSLLWAAPYVVITWALTLPWTIYTGFLREHQYDLATQGFGAWFGEQLLGLAIATIVTSLLIAGLLALVRRFGERWWGIGTAVTVAFFAFMLLLAPVFVQPLFNKYTPMEAGALRDQILAMARANTVPADNVYVVDQSRQTTRISANVSGLGPTIRIALNDNLLRQSTPAEARSVMGHELGHYVLNHSFSLLLGLGLVILLAYLAVARLVPAMLRRWGGRWGVERIEDPATVPAAVIVIAIYVLLATPFTNSLIRVHEQEADIFGLNAARAPDGFAQIAMKLSTYRKIEPAKWEEIIFYDHPSGRTRVETAMRWKAEHIGEPDIE